MNRSPYGERSDEKTKRKERSVKKIVLVAFQGELLCFAHVLINALDMKGRGYEAKVVIDGEATGLIGDFLDRKNSYAQLFQRVKTEGMIDCVCEACSAKMGTVGIARAQKLQLCGEMSGHPSLAKYIEEGYQILIF